MNSICVIGRLTSDPDHHTYDNRQGATGTVARFRVAVDRGRRDGTDFFDVVTFGPTAQAVLDHVGKGRKVAVNGWLESTEWTSPEGQHRTGVQIHATQVDFLEAPRT